MHRAGDGGAASSVTAGVWRKIQTQTIKEAQTTDSTPDCKLVDGRECTRRQLAMCKEAGHFKHKHQETNKNQQKVKDPE